MGGAGFPARDARLQALLGEVDAALRANDIARAMQVAQTAVGEGLEHPFLLSLFAYQLHQQGQPEKALKYAERARTLAPQDVYVLNTLGLCLNDLTRYAEATAAYDVALTIAPDAPGLHFNKARALEALGEFGVARQHLERTIALEPAHAMALGRLAMLAVTRSDVPSARDYASRALCIDPRQDVAILALSGADLVEKDFATTKDRVLPLANDATIDPVNRAIAQGLLGDALDGLGDTRAAFLAYASAKATYRQLYMWEFATPGMETALMRVRRMISYFTAAPAKLWIAEPAPANAAPSQPVHIFLVGFPRSGTTLLEQILGSHPSIETLGEKDCLADAAADFLSSTAGLDRLASIGERHAAHHREQYWRNAIQAGATLTNEIFVDKLPLNSIYLCLIAKFFPNAKIIFAIRDPRDVVLSCFRQRFAMNADMYQFTTLEGTVQYYDAVMTLAMLYREKLTLDIHDIRYKDVLADFEGEIRDVCGFLGIKWTAAMTDFAKHARSRDISTPSSTQVTRGLYRQGYGQWRRYRKELEPILPLLQPWVERFGYSPE